MAFLAPEIRLSISTLRIVWLGVFISHAIVGFLLYAAAVAAAVVAILRRGRAGAVTALGLAAAVCLVHSLVDIDWDYISVQGPLFLTVGALVSGPGTARRRLIPAAAELLASAPEMADSSSEKNEVQLSLLVLGDCLLRLGDQRGCEVLIAQLRGTLEFNLSWAAATDRLEAQLLSDNGKPEEALLLIDGCLQASIESPVQAAEAYFVEARILQVLGRHDEARSAAAMAFDIYSGLRAQSRMKEIDHWLRAYSGRSRGRPKARIISNLTLRELEILGLVVTGATNSEIAAALFISVGTVKKHIENIRLKIGAGRRSELISMGLPIVRRSRQSQSV